MSWQNSKWPFTEPKLNYATPAARKSIIQLSKSGRKSLGRAAAKPNGTGVYPPSIRLPACPIRKQSAPKYNNKIDCEVCKEKRIAD